MGEPMQKQSIVAHQNLYLKSWQIQIQYHMVACSSCTSYQEVYLTIPFRNVLHPREDALLLGKNIKTIKQTINVDLTIKLSCILLIKGIPLFDAHLMKRLQKLLITEIKNKMLPHQSLLTHEPTIIVSI